MAASLTKKKALWWTLRQVCRKHCGEFAANCFQQLFTMQMRFAANLPQLMRLAANLPQTIGGGSFCLRQIYRKPHLHGKSLQMFAKSLRQICSKLHLHSKFADVRQKLLVTLRQTSFAYLPVSANMLWRYFGKHFGKVLANNFFKHWNNKN